MRTRKYPVVLSEAEQAGLRTLVGRGSAPARALTQARILLKANEGEGGVAWADTAIAAALEVGLSTVARVRECCVRDGVEAAVWRKAPDRAYARKLDGEQEAHLIALACSAAPAGHRRWSLRLLADRLVELAEVETLSYETVRRTLKKTNSSRG